MKKDSTRKLVILALLTACVIVLGYISVPLPAGLSLTLNAIPVALAALVLGPTGGLTIGCAFGLISFCQCFGVFGFSGMGATTLQLSVLRTLLQRLVPRALDGLLTGCLASWAKRHMPIYLAGAVSGFSAAFLNTVFFMSALVIFFGHEEFMQTNMAGLTPLGYILASIGVQAIIEMVASTIITAAVGTALSKAKYVKSVS